MPEMTTQPAPRRAVEALQALGSSLDRGLSEAEAARRLAEQGPNAIEEKPRHPLLRFARKFWGLSAWMLELIAVLSAVLHKFADLGVAAGLLVVNAVISFAQEERASKAVAALRGRLQVTARVLRDGAWSASPARGLVTGDVVRLRAGDFVPADVHLADGALQADQSALTGESNEVERRADQVVFSGSMVRQGEATGVVVATGARTSFGRTAQLVRDATPKLHVEAVIARVVRWMLIIVGVLVAATLVVSLARGDRLVDILPISLVLLMGAVPVALPVMFTVSMALGSMELGRRGALISRLSAVEDAATMDVLCADKTGTLTLNRLTLAGVVPQPGSTEADVVQAGALASNAANADPIDTAFLEAAAKRGLLPAGAATLSFQPFSAATRRTEAVVELGGRRLKVMKGALRTIAEQAGLDASALRALEDRARAEAARGVRVLAVARAEGEGPLALAGLALLYDAPRPDSRQLIDELRGLGITVKMLTGDALAVAVETSRELGLGPVVRAPELRAAPSLGGPDLAAAGGFAEVFPEDKYLVVERLQGAGHVVGMTGDGVNDAPALRQAEVGIAVSGATDVAKGAASVVLTTEGLANIVDLVKIGRATYQRVLTWIVNKVSRTIVKSGFVVVAYLVTGQFVISALGMVLLMFLTDFVKISLSSDRVRASQRPETWNIGPLVRVGVVVGALMLVESLGLLAFAWPRLELGARDGRLQTFAFQTLLFFALFSVLSVRERRAFWRSRPGGWLLAGLALDAVVGAAVGLWGLSDLRPLPLWVSASVFAFTALCGLGPNDALKAMLIARTTGPAVDRGPPRPPPVPAAGP